MARMVMDAISVSGTTPYIAGWQRQEARMKTFAKTASLFLVLTACAPPAVRFMRYTSAAYPPTSNVEVLHMKPPDKRFRELGLLSIRLNKNTEENAVLYLLERAKQAGADAIVILGEVSAGAIAAPVGTMAVAIPLRDLQALAIRYEP
jgi:hypothetical protein